MATLVSSWETRRPSTKGLFEERIKSNRPHQQQEKRKRSLGDKFPARVISVECINYPLLFLVKDSSLMLHAFSRHWAWNEKEMNFDDEDKVSKTSRKIHSRNTTEESGCPAIQINLKWPFLLWLQVLQISSLRFHLFSYCSTLSCLTSWIIWLKSVTQCFLFTWKSKDHNTLKQSF